MKWAPCIEIVIIIINIIIIIIIIGQPVLTFDKRHICSVSYALEKTVKNNTSWHKTVSASAVKVNKFQDGT